MGPALYEFVRATGHELSSENAICRYFSREEWATNGPQQLYETSAETTQLVDLQGKTSAGATGLEPATSGVTGRRSNQLNYAPADGEV
jgi:hypothetical protein